MWEQLLFDNASEISTALVTLFIAWIKKRIDLRKLKKSGRLIEIENVIKNGKVK
jgi:hypothetical protein